MVATGGQHDWTPSRCHHQSGGSGANSLRTGCKRGTEFLSLIPRSETPNRKLQIANCKSQIANRKSRRPATVSVHRHRLLETPAGDVENSAAAAPPTVANDTGCRATASDPDSLSNAACCSTAIVPPRLAPSPRLLLQDGFPPQAWSLDPNLRTRRGDNSFRLCRRRHCRSH